MVGSLQYLWRLRVGGGGVDERDMRFNEKIFDSFDFDAINMRYYSRFEEGEV